MAGSGDAFMGRLSGRIGNLVVYQMVGKTVVRIRPAYRNKKATGKLKASQDDFKEVVAVLSKCRNLLLMGFAAQAVNRSAWNAALSANLKNYRETENKNLANWLQLCKDVRDEASDWQLAQTQDGQLRLSWKQLPPQMSRLNDKLIVFIVPENSENQALIEISSAQRRHEHAVVEVDIARIDNAEVFAAFINADYNGNLKPEGISNNTWVGRLS
ncbi:MAG: hypothetical protein KJ578_00270 [Bacteroidetes bacterium]|nr:hypothetical protein [Bacteroidota bacterium]MBU1579878.1 hypothetical protein [Bacteroidota bacterium]MBU2465633.1 hypothetical protein [Bacteroidota bacterium]MBU2556194.1 hypothetical protein [Bacteroidota bacterium]